jgi:hypothetical protein
MECSVKTYQKYLPSIRLLKTVTSINVHITPVPVTAAWCVLWVADGGDGLQIWRVSANILKYAVAESRSGPPAWVLGEGLTNSHHKNSSLRNVTQSLGIGGVLWKR